MAAATVASPRAGQLEVVQAGPDGYSAFLPAALPPAPPLEIDSDLQALLDKANQALGRLDGVTLLLPDPEQFIYTYVRKEAVLSSQIEGTQSSLDLLLFEADAAPGVPVGDAEEASNYIAALQHGLDRVRSGELPLCNRLFREMHELLLRTGRGSEATPGRFRKEQNWLGGSGPAAARYVPPPWEKVEPAMADLERYINDVNAPILVKAALSHAQFESIHPFLDGNGRVGRILIALLLAAEGVLRQPLLYLSLYLKQNRTEYYDHLQRIRTDGAWESWLEFFLRGVVEVAEATTLTTQSLVQMIERDRQSIHGLGRSASTALRVHDYAARFVILRPPVVARALELSDPPVYSAIGKLEDAGILREMTGRERGKLYAYSEYLDLLNQGTVEPAG